MEQEGAAAAGAVPGSPLVLPLLPCPLLQLLFDVIVSQVFLFLLTDSFEEYWPGTLQDALLVKFVRCYSHD